MSRNGWPQFLLTAFTSLWLLATAAAAVRPNVLLIITDDQGYGDFSLHGNKQLKTPNLDRFARENIQFERFFVSPLCAPTRASLLTGRYSLRTGVWGVTHNKEAMRPSEVTIAEALKGAGYRTACIGKWHNGEQFPYTPAGQGFDVFVGFHNGHWNNYFDSEILRGTRFEKTRGYLPDVLTDEAITFMKQPSPQPFFCYLAFNTPHSPYQVPDPFFDRFKDQKLDPKLAAVYAMCENIDANVGKLLKFLDDAGLREKTLVLFLTDNGPNGARFNGGMRGTKGSVHEGGCRVPLFLRLPGKQAKPQLVREIAAHIDLYPTILDICGVAAPRGPVIDGKSLLPLLAEPDKPWPERLLFTHHVTRNRDLQKFPGAVRSTRYRLVHEIKGTWQLYDMINDPTQTTDLAGKQPEIVKELAQAYDRWYADVSRAGVERFPVPVGHPEENPVELHAPQAYFMGAIQFHGKNGFANDWLENWTRLEDNIWFDIDVAHAGTYEVSLRFLCPKADAGSGIRIKVGGRSIEGKIPAAESEAIALPHRDGPSSTYVNRTWGTLTLGRIELPKGRTKLTLSPTHRPGKEVMQFKSIVLKKLD